MISSCSFGCYLARIDRACDFGSEREWARLDYDRSGDHNAHRPSMTRSKSARASIDFAALRMLSLLITLWYVAVNQSLNG